MNLTTMEDFLYSELRDLYSGEKQLTEALPKMAEGATAPALKDAFKKHLEQTKEHISRLDKAFKLMDRTARAENCEAMEGLVEEGEEIIEAKGDDSVRDAALIVGAQKVEHYEIAGYGSARTIAKLLGLNDVAALLEKTLEEEKETDVLLTELAVSKINIQAQQAT